jgi:hypothetical protein
MKHLKSSVATPTARRDQQGFYMARPETTTGQLLFWTARNHRGKASRIIYSGTVVVPGLEDMVYSRKIGPLKQFGLRILFSWVRPDKNPIILGLSTLRMGRKKASIMMARKINNHFQ